MKTPKVAVDIPATDFPQAEREMMYGLLPQILGYHLRRTQVAIFRHFLQTVATAENITPGLFGMLQVIAANPGLGQSRLAEAMEVDRSTVVKVIDQLERRGLIVRAPSPNDKRSHCLRLTGKGRTALRRMETLVLMHESEFTEILSADERQILVGLLMRLYNRTKAGSPDFRPQARYGGHVRGKISLPAIPKRRHREASEILVQPREAARRRRQ